MSNTVLIIRGYSINVDIESELRDYDWGNNARWTSDKLVASSPFRQDNTPSFYVNLNGEYAGVWGDSGTTDEQYSSGNFVALISYLRGISYEEATEYLLGKYDTEYEGKSGQTIRIPAPRLYEKKQPRSLPDNLVTQAISPYIKSRGISDEAQREYGIGYGDDYKGFTAIPWHTPQGRLANIKYRSTTDKRFFYEKDATPVRKLVYGMDVINERNAGYAVLCEGEIDVLSWRTAGIPAIAIGGAHASEEQIDEIKRSKIKRLYLGGDNDEQGRKLNRQVEKELRGYVEMFEIDYGKEKDANDILRRNNGVTELEKLTTQEKTGNRLHCYNVNVI